MLRSLTALAGWLDQTALAGWLQRVSWAVPLIQAVHILAIAIVLSSALIMALSCLGWFDGLCSTERWNRRLNAWAASALVVLALSGALLVVSEPARALLSGLFQLKMLLVAMAVILARQGTRSVRSAAAQTRPGRGSAKSRVLALLSLVNLVILIAAGRWIAYYSGS